MEHPDFLKKKYDLHNAPEVEAAVERTERHSGEKFPRDPESRIQNYLDRLSNVFNPPKLEAHPDFGRQKRNVEMLKKMIFEKFVTKFDEVPDSYLEKQLRERGMAGDYSQASEEQKKEFKRQNIEPVLRDQWASLEQWVDYFAMEDSFYIPDYLKYWIFREVTGLQEYDKEKKKFPKRSKGTVGKFPDLNQEALNYVIDAIKKKYEGKQVEFEYDIQPEERQKFSEYLQGENFAKLYAWSTELINPIPEHLLLITEGEWKKYSQGSDYKPLVKSIRGKGTGWCTAGENTAKTQLRAGDFYVYYSLDDEKNPTIPRIAIRMEGDKIGEIRGVAYKQNMDPYIGGALEKKLNEKDKFPDKEHYLKKDGDMKLLTEIERKIKKGEQPTKDDLIFLYEIDSTIEGFGYQRDPRIEEIRKTRNPQEDAPIVFECDKSQIAHKPEDISKDTKAYVGELKPGIFQQLPENLEHVYTKFPSERIKFRKIERDANLKNAEDFSKAIKAGEHEIGSWAEDILKKIKIDNIKKESELAILTVASLGFTNGATTKEIYNRALELGLKLCPAQIGPELRIQYKKDDQLKGEYLLIGMDPITDSDGFLSVFLVHRYDDGKSWLNTSYGGPGRRWSADDQWVFVRRKLKT